MWNSNKWKKIIILLVAIAAAALLAGGYCYYSYAFPGNALIWIWMSLHNCVESLLFNPILPIQDFMSDTGFVSGLGIVQKVIMVLYSMAIVLAPFVDILVIFSVLDSFLHLFVDTGFKKRRILIVGYNDKVRKLIERKNRTGKVYLWTEEYLSSDEERELYLKNVSVKMNDFSLGDSDSNEEYRRQRSRFDRFIDRKRITDILLLNESDAKNFQYYMALSSCDVCKVRTIHFYVLNNTFETRNMIQTYFDAKMWNDHGVINDKQKKTIPQDVNTHMDLRIFNYDQIQAEVLLAGLPVYSGYEDRSAKGDKHVHMLIIGGNSLCKYIALHAMNQSVFSSDNSIVIDIVNDSVDSIMSDLSDRLAGTPFTADTERREFSISSDSIDGSLKIRLFECRLMDPELSGILSELQDEDSGDFTYVALCSRNIDENLHTFLCLDEGNIIAGANSVPVAVRMSYSEEMMDHLSSFGWCSRVFLMGENEEYIGLDQIINFEEEKYIRSYHATYEYVSNTKIFSSDSGLSDPDAIERMWNRSEYYKRQSDRALYHHKDVKKAFFPDHEEEMRRFWAQPLPDDDKDKGRAWSDRLAEEGNYPVLYEMAKTEHRRWSYFFASEGWEYSEKKSPGKRQHDCLCNWEKLKETKPDVLIYDMISSPELMNTDKDL